MSERNVRRRAKIFKNFIETAKQCLELRNYNAVMVIVVAALGSAPVRRLEGTKEQIPPESMSCLQKIENLMDSKGNHKKYREAIRTSQTPAVPYFGIYLKDLTFISDGNPDYLKGGVINLNKRRKVGFYLNSTDFSVCFFFDNTSQNARTYADARAHAHALALALTHYSHTTHTHTHARARTHTHTHMHTHAHTHAHTHTHTCAHMHTLHYTTHLISTVWRDISQHLFVCFFVYCLLNRNRNRKVEQGASNSILHLISPHIAVST